MKSGLEKYWGIDQNKIDLYPFFSGVEENQDSLVRNPNTYFFISDGHPNKMHNYLLPAFLKASKQFPEISLGLTISSQYPELIKTIETARQEGVKIHNMGWCDQERLAKIYKNGGFLIFPSNTESFGLGMIEAAQYGMPVLASDLPFVHEVIRPSATFDPYSIDSIATAIEKSQTEILPETQLCISNRVHQLIQLLVE
jgi:glycosyltransferase involved in cell wall biosynthesis